MSVLSVTVGLDAASDPPVTATLRRDGVTVADAPFDADAWTSFVQGIRHAFGDQAADQCVAELRALADGLQARSEQAAQQKTALEQTVAAVTSALPSK